MQQEPKQTPDERECADSSSGRSLPAHTPYRFSESLATCGVPLPQTALMYTHAVTHTTTQQHNNPTTHNNKTQHCSLVQSNKTVRARDEARSFRKRKKRIRTYRKKERALVSSSSL
eukprot:TRINITY_DN6476_c0_g1_i1.p1 TRINITY_DN6476_c0_g1~~TRINITY_DN6476_c0_g1_i1.p1  ORF type:complete len:116 (+),score=29.60 TRINITY_DN6476_c0_g1_i1:254-601(+)